MARTSVSNRLVVRDFGSSLSFSGNTHRVSNATAVTGFATASTISCWVRTGNNVTTSQRLIAIASANSSTGLCITLLNGILRGGYYNGTSYVSPTSYVGITPLTWYHVVCTWNGTASKLYVNSVEAVTTGNNPSLNQLVGTFVGASNLGPLGGTLIDEACVWTKALTPTEVSDLYYIGKVPSDSLWLHWKFNEGSGSSALDSSDNNRQGTITGPTYSTIKLFSLRSANATSRLNTATKVLDTFTRANSTNNLGSTSFGNLSWSVITGTAGVTSNQGYFSTNTADSIVVVDAGTPNVEAAISFTTYADEPALYFRVLDTRNWWRVVRSTTSLILQKMVDNVKTSIKTVSFTPVAGDQVKVRLSGDDIKVFLNDALRITHVSADNNSNTKHGFGGASGTNQSSNRYDDFELKY